MQNNMRKKSVDLEKLEEMLIDNCHTMGEAQRIKMTFSNFKKRKYSLGAKLKKSIDY